MQRLFYPDTISQQEPSRPFNTLNMPLPACIDLQASRWKAARRQHSTCLENFHPSLPVFGF
jgi:hypothetical protein